MCRGGVSFKECVQESLMMGVAMTEVKDHMESWLTKRTADLTQEFEGRLSRTKVGPLTWLHNTNMHDTQVT